jgi:hypothetical protein
VEALAHGGLDRLVPLLGVSLRHWGSDGDTRREARYLVVAPFHDVSRSPEQDDCGHESSTPTEGAPGTRGWTSDYALVNVRLSGMTARSAPTTWAGADRFYRPIFLGLTLVVLALGAMIVRAQYGAFADRGLVAVDYRMFMELGSRWLETGSMYAPWQFSPYNYAQGAGTTDFDRMPALYPPLAGPVFAAWTFLPVFLWWAIPVGILAYMLYRFRPAPWAWPLMALATWNTNTTGVYTVGGSSMWIAAGVAAGLVWGWPALVILFKPSLAPFLLVGVRKRAFWIGALVLGAVSLLMLPEWFRYVEVLRNTESPGVLYSLRDIPLMLVPVIAWISRGGLPRGSSWSLLARRTSGDPARPQPVP